MEMGGEFWLEHGQSITPACVFADLHVPSRLDSTYEVRRLCCKEATCSDGLVHAWMAGLDAMLSRSSRSTPKRHKDPTAYKTYPKEYPDIPDNSLVKKTASNLHLSPYGLLLPTTTVYPPDTSEQKTLWDGHLLEKD